MAHTGRISRGDLFLAPWAMGRSKSVFALLFCSTSLCQERRDRT